MDIFCNDRTCKHSQEGQVQDTTLEGLTVNATNVTVPPCRNAIWAALSANRAADAWSGAKVAPSTSPSEPIASCTCIHGTHQVITNISDRMGACAVVIVGPKPHIYEWSGYQRPREWCGTYHLLHPQGVESIWVPAPSTTQCSRRQRRGRVDPTQNQAPNADSCSNLKPRYLPSPAVFR